MGRCPTTVTGPARQHMVNLLRQVFVVGVEQVFTLQQHAQSHSLMHKHTIPAQNFHDRHLPRNRVGYSAKPRGFPVKIVHTIRQ